MAEHASIVRVARFRPAAGKRDELISRLQGGIEGIRQMEGCFGAQLGTLREDPEVIAAISRWASQAALDAFLQSSIVQRRETDTLATAPPTIETFVSL
jgi:quinol monooxygenase YgiN